jgi:hypothetical protein
MMFLRILLPVVIACPLLAQGVKIQFEPVDQAVVKARLDRNPATNGERAAALHKMFEEAGCTGAMLTDQAVDGARQPNVVCTISGGTGSTIVVGAHMDFSEDGRGMVENWTGTSLLPSLFEALHQSPRKHKFVFVGFTDREKGRRGSIFYVKSLGEEKTQVKAMIDVEGLGMGQTKVQMENSDKGLSQKMASIAKSLGIPVAGADTSIVGDSDGKSFSGAKIPVLSVHSLSGNAVRVPGSHNDNSTAVQEKDYYESYRLISAFLAYLDESLN